ncbi:MAG: response regulator [candidate division Zixibacteria bacterium]|nr:response regulator [candidate division Zixibacteria bacterium]
MQMLKDISIKNKLTVIVMLTSTIALLLACLVFVVSDRFTMKDSMIRDLSTLADIIASNSTAAIIFNSKDDARETLAALKAEPHLISACIYSQDGRQFATYIRDNEVETTLPIKPAVNGHLFGEDNLSLFKQITIKGKPIGTLYLNSDLEEIQTRLNKYISIVAIVMLVSLLVAFVVVSKLQKIVSQPIIHLTEVAKDVSENQDYSIRASEFGQDEAGFLIEKFNEMLSQIYQRDAALRDAHDSMEERVKERTIELENEIVERGITEESLRESRQKLALHMEQSPLAVIEWNLDFQVVVWNKTAEKIFGFTKDEAIGYHAAGLIVPESIKKDIDEIWRDLLANKGENRSTNENFTKDGRKILCEWYNTSLVDSEGKTIGVASLVQDITERRKIEERQKELQAKLERAERMESLGILAGGIAHDLNNILGPLVGYPELMLMKLPQDSPIRKQIERLGNAAQGAADVVQDLLTLARRGRYEMIPTNINEITASYLDSPGFTKLKETHPDIKVNLKLDKSIANISGSTPHLSKVYMNLIVNAFDAMPDGGELEIATSHDYLESLKSGHDKIENGNYVVFRVCDTGIGIDPKELDKIFEPYYSKKKMGSSGSGLGLSVVYGIVKDHKGYYDILSQPGNGTEFILYFPAIEEEIDKTQLADKIKGGRELVLVVDDDENQRELASAILSSLGYKVEKVCNGREAVEFMSHNNVDIIILDMIMEPGFDGLDTYREIIKRHPRQKAIIASGFSETDRVKEAEKLGVGKYVKKPYTIRQLDKAIRHELDPKPSAMNRNTMASIK